MDQLKPPSSGSMVVEINGGQRVSVPKVYVEGATQPESRESRQSLSPSMAPGRKSFVSRPSIARTMQAWVALSQIGDREDPYLDNELLARLRISRKWGRFTHEKTEQLFGTYIYRDRVEHLVLSNWLFFVSILVYAGMEILTILNIPAQVFRLFQLCVVGRVLFWLHRENKQLKNLDKLDLQAQGQNTSQETAETTRQIMNLPAVQRATSHRAVKNMDMLSTFCLIFAQITIVILRYLMGNWDESPTTLILINWCAPVLCRATFVHALVCSIITFVFFSISTIVQTGTSNSFIVLGSLISSSMCGVFLCYTSAIYRRMQLRSMIAEEYKNRRIGETSTIDVVRKDKEARQKLYESYKHMKFKEAATETEYLDFISTRSKLFIRLTHFFLILTNVLLYLPDSQVADTAQSAAFTIRSYVVLPIWVCATASLFVPQLKNYRPYITTAAVITNLIGEFFVILKLTYSQTDTYFVFMWRLLDVTSTSLCLPLRFVSVIYLAFFSGSIAMGLLGNVYFIYLADMVIIVVTCLAGIYLSRTSQRDARIAFLHRRETPEARRASLIDVGGSFTSTEASSSEIP